MVIHGESVYLDSTKYKSLDHVKISSDVKYIEGDLPSFDYDIYVNRIEDWISKDLQNPIFDENTKLYVDNKLAEDIVISEGVESIKGRAFFGCSSLTNIFIPKSVTSIGESFLFNCSGLTSCTIGSGVTSIGQTVFSYCNRLSSITVNATTPPTLGNNVFQSTNNCPIYVPANSVNAYKSASGWSSYSSRIQAIP